MNTIDVNDSADGTARGRLEWHEPTIVEVAEWDWWRVIGPRTDKTWGTLSEHERREHVKQFESGLNRGAPICVLLRDAYTLARAVDYERAIEEALAPVEAAIAAMKFDAPTNEVRDAVNKRDELLDRRDAARSRINTLVAKVLGRHS